MKKIRFTVLLLAAFCLCLWALAPSMAGASTLDALPAAAGEKPHAIFHMEDINGIAGRLKDSALLSGRPDEPQPLRDAVLQWFSQFPLESLSLIFWEDPENGPGFQGAMRFAGDKQGLLEKLAKGNFEEIEEEYEDSEVFPAELFGVADPKTLDDLIEFSIEQPDGGVNVYELEIETQDELYDIFGDHEFLVTPAKDGDEWVLLAASSPEGLEAAKAALTNEGKRLKVERGTAHANFLRFDDDKGGSFTQMGISVFGEMTGREVEAKAPALAELSLGLEDNKITVSLRHNLFDVLFGGAEKPKSALSLEDPGLKFGGGTPWLAGIGSVPLNGDAALTLFAALAGASVGEAREFLGESGVDIEKIAAAFRSFGLVLGGESQIGKGETQEAVPGGYAFISGPADAMREAVLPLARALLTPAFKDSPKDGWDFFAVPNVLDESYQPPMPIFVGLKDGTFVAGSLTDAALGKAPDFKWNAAQGEPPLLLVKLKTDALFSMARRFLSPVVAPALEAADMEDVKYAAEEIATPGKTPFPLNFLFESLPDIESASLIIGGWGEAELSLTTGGASSGKSLREILFGADTTK